MLNSTSGCETKDCKAGLLHQVLTSFQANFVGNYSKQKTRGEVHHSTRKLFPQKGRGKARVGMCSTPNRRGGGVSFAGDSVNHKMKKINKQMYHKTMDWLLIQTKMNCKLLVLNIPSLITSTHQMLNIIQALVLDQSVVLVTAGKEMAAHLHITTRNLSWITVLTTEELTPQTLIHFGVVMFTFVSCLKTNMLY